MKSYHETAAKPSNNQGSGFIPNLGDFDLGGAQKPKLTKTDLERLAESAITPKLAEMAKLFRVDSDTSHNLANRKIRLDKNYSGIAYPYFLPGDYIHARAYRIRLDKPEIDSSGKEMKYLVAYATQNKFYFPPGLTVAMLKDTSLPACVFEGEKKTLFGLRVATKDFTQPLAFLPLGVAGCWNWRDSFKTPSADAPTTEKVKRPMADFGLLAWQGRKVTICFDSDVVTNPAVLAAEKALAETLKTMLADVHICRIPMGGAR